MKKESMKHGRFVKMVILASLLVLVMSLCGCIRYRTTVTVNTDGTADLSILYAMSDEVMSMMGDEEDTSLADDESEAEFEAEGWTFETYAQDDYTGYVITKKGIAMEDLADAINSADEENTFSVSKDGNTYTIDWQIADDSSVGSMAEDATYLESYDGFMELVLVLPNKSTNNNATTVSSDGKTLTWNLVALTDNNVHAEFEVAGGGLNMSLIIVIVLVVVIVIIVIVVISSKKKKGIEQVVPTPSVTPEESAPVESAPVETAAEESSASEDEQTPEA